MNNAVTIPLFALVLFMASLYFDNKFSYFYHGKDHKKSGETETGWRRFVILKNEALKFCGLALMWFAFSIAAVIADGEMGPMVILAYSIGLTGFLVYIVSRSWPFISRH